MSTVLASDAARPAPPEALIADLNPAQREAVLATSGPVAILAGAGTGKTRVISRRTAVAIATGVVPADQVLVVTFTEKAAGEMVDRLRRLGLPGVTARTFHAHALSQLRHFWPSRHEGAPLPELLDTKLPILGRLARQLPGHYRFTPSRDLATEIEWAKSRRIAPGAYLRTIGDREPPIPADLMARIFADYERVKTRSGRMDFDDLLADTIDLLETDAEAAATIRARKRWFSVDEYQDTNPLQQRLLELWAGDSPDLCVVGDEDQTIYSFTGATSSFLTGFAERHPGARIVELTENYRSTPQVLELANRLLATDPVRSFEHAIAEVSGARREKRLTATRDDGPAPRIERHPTAAAEEAAIVAAVRELIAGGVVPAEIALLVRMNAQLAPLEEAFTRAGIAYQVRGVRFYDRPEVAAAIRLVKRGRLEARGPALGGAVEALWRTELGFGEEAAGDEARERNAALETLLAILRDLVTADPDADAAAFLADVDARARHERDGAADGVNLLTYHRAKGLEWDAVLLPMLEDGTLPIRQAFDDPEALAEERRLLYVGITRARVHLILSWADRRETRGRDARRERSRFLLDLGPRLPRRVVQLPDAVPMGASPRRKGAAAESDDPLVVALRAWRTARARSDGVSAFVIAHDATLLEIAAARPTSLAALRRVKGMGPAKLEKYGEEILAALADPGPAPG